MRLRRSVATCSRSGKTEKIACLSASALAERLEEEINRAGRHGTPLSCLLVTIGNLDELSRDHGSELLERTLAYVGSALWRQLRRFDRIGRDSSCGLCHNSPTFGG